MPCARRDGSVDEASLLLEAADQADLLGRYELALAWYERAGDWLPAWIGRAKVLRKTGRFDEAREVAGAGRERFSDHPTSSAALLLQDGRALISAGSYAEAAEVLAEALEQAPTTGTLRTSIEVHLADALAMLGRTEEALTYGERAMAAAWASRNNPPGWRSRWLAHSVGCSRTPTVGRKRRAHCARGWTWPAGSGTWRSRAPA